MSSTTANTTKQGILWFNLPKLARYQKFMTTN